MIGGGWLLLVVILGIASLSLREAPIILATILVFATGGLVRLWTKYLFTGVTYAQSLTRTRAFSGDEVTLEIQVTNEKILPLPWFRVEIEVPETVQWARASTSLSPNRPRRLLMSAHSIGPYHRVTRRYAFTVGKRGFFPFGPTKLEAGDFFGFLRKRRQQDDFCYLTVYPKVLPLEALGIASKDLFGDIRAKRHLFEDPVRVASIREYAPGDPLNRIHWKSSARLGTLQTKVFEHTTTVDTGIFLDSRTVPRPHWGHIDDLLELGVVTTASIANYATEHDIRVGLYVNQSHRLSDRVIQLPPSSHPDQLMHILDALAHVHAQELFPIERLIQIHARKLPWNDTLVVIAAVPHSSLIDLLRQHQRSGRKVALIITGGISGISGRTHIPIYHVSDAVAWDVMESVSIQEGMR